jgi:hypothetical protein
MTSASGRRNFIRGAVSLVDRYTASYREMGQLGFEFGIVALDADEVKVMKNERGFSAADRTRLSLQVAFRCTN